MDIHCHVLPGLDDGSKNMEETLEMLRAAADAGITDIIVTPHFKGGRHNANPSDIYESINEVWEEADRQGIYINLYPGNEIFYFNDMEEALENDWVCTMNSSQYILLEFSPLDSFRTIRNAMDQVLGMEYRPILAHVERYNCMLEDWRNVESLRSMGVEIQVNASGVAGRAGRKVKKFVRLLLDRQLVDYIATDAHGSRSGITDLKRCLKQLCKRCDPSYLEYILCGNALKMIVPQEM